MTTTNDFRMLGIPALETLSSSINAFEKRIFSFGDCGQDNMDTHRLLGIELTATPNGAVSVGLGKTSYQGPDTYTLAQANRMTTLLTCYRLLDMLCSRDASFNNRRGRIVEGVPPTNAKAATLPFVSATHNWSSFMSTFYSSTSSLSQAATLVDPLDTSGVDGTGLQTTSSLLVKQLVVNRKQRHLNTVESNFLLCALAMVGMLRFTSDKGDIPSLPDTSEAFADIVGDWSMLNGEKVRSDDTKELIDIYPVSAEHDKTSGVLLRNESNNQEQDSSDTTPTGEASSSSQSHSQSRPPSHTVSLSVTPSPSSSDLSTQADPKNAQLPLPPVSSQQSQLTSPVITPFNSTASTEPQPLSVPSFPIPPTNTTSHSNNITSNNSMGSQHQNSIVDTIDPGTVRGSRRSAVNALERILAVNGDKKASSSSVEKASNANKRKAGNTEPGGPSTNGRAIDVIDVDAFVALRDPVGIAPVILTRRRKEPLNVDIPVQRIVSAEPLVAYDIAGESHEFYPPAHYDDYISRLETLASRAKESYVNDRPKHVSSAASVFHRMSYREFSTTSPVQLQDILRTKCIVLTDWGRERSGFDSKNLQDIVPLFRPISIQDYSVRPPPETPNTQSSSCSLPSTPVVLTGTMQQMLENTSLGSNRKILNALDLPVSGTLATPSALSSDFFAWEAMKGIHQHLDFLAYPTSDMSWYLAALEGAVTFFHIDSDGLATGVNVEYGKKLWAIMTPHSSIGPCDVNGLTSEEFSLDEVGDLRDVDIEMVVLRATDGIVMGPNTLHAAYSISDCICKGFHFYSPSLLLRTAAGLINTFILSSFISNTHHNSTRSLLLRMLAFNFAEHIEKRFGSCEFDKFHLIDITNWKGLSALLTLCNLVILSNVLDFRTYLGPNQPDDSSPTPKHINDMDSFDSNHISWAERMAICDARGRAWTILVGVMACCEITSIQETSSRQFSTHDISNIPLVHLARQLVAIGSLKSSAIRSKLDGAPHCTVELLTRQLDNVARWRSDLQQLYAHRELITLDCTQTSFNGEEGFKIRWKDDLHVWYADTRKAQLDDTSFMDEGITDLDRKFLTRDLNSFRPAKRSKLAI
ncbi:hypothetical protein CVT24_012309 [Panaeolus cyanescens]|uniref:JmjC domain-containing protein n=1 Tax=Panaeolus cyanescens TaxID=181874 RepID=A0A409W442_9AGAR|nr:hypothetical protein CVT24_012309 [Panaeolus cyanescens]